MARVQNPLIGRASGSVGGATFTTWKGINVLKAKPESVANPQTLGQISQRNRFSLMVSVYRLLATLIAVGYASQAIAKSAYNAFISDNAVPATSVDGSGNASLDYSALSLSKGTIGSIPVESISATNGDPAVNISWDSTLSPVGSNSSDVAYCAIYNERLDEWTTSFGDTRVDAGIEPSFGSNVQTGDVLHAYLFFKSANDNDVSDSSYGTLTVS